MLAPDITMSYYFGTLPACVLRNTQHLLFECCVYLCTDCLSDLSCLLLWLAELAHMSFSWPITGSEVADTVHTLLKHKILWILWQSLDNLYALSLWWWPGSIFGWLAGESTRAACPGPPPPPPPEPRAASPPPAVAADGSTSGHQSNICWRELTFAKFHRARRRPLLGHSPCWKHLILALSQLRI